MKHYFIIIFLFSTQLRAQTCDSLRDYGYGSKSKVSLSTLEKLIEDNCDKAKLYLADELLKGYRIEKDSLRAIELLTDCNDRNINCKYELFKINYDENPEKAYQLISELALRDTLTTYWDSAMGVNARLIAANMVQLQLGNNEDLSKSATWYLLSYEIDGKWDKNLSKNMMDEMFHLLETLNEKQLNTAFSNAEKILGHKSLFTRNELANSKRNFENRSEK